MPPNPEANMNMELENGWDNLIASYWSLSRTFWYLSIGDIRCLRSVNRKQMIAIDSFIQSMRGSIHSLIGKEAFVIVGSFLTMDDLRNFNSVSHGCRFSVRKYSSLLPRDVRSLVRSWCEEEKSAMLMYSFECYQHPHHEFSLYHPPILQLSLGPMAFDVATNKMRGRPLEEVQINSLPPQNLGRREPFVCAIDKSLVFYCGGKSYVEGEHTAPWLWMSPMHWNSDYSTTCALLDINAGMWRRLQQMPEPRAGGAACRIGHRVFVFGGIKPDLRDSERSFETIIFNRPPFAFVFDLHEERWVGDHGIQNFPGIHQECHAAISIGPDAGIIVSRQQVFALNITDGVWSRLPNIPVHVGRVVCCRVIGNSKQKSQRLVVIGRNSWALLAISSIRGEVSSKEQQWRMSPDLCGSGLPNVALFCGDSVRVFSGNSWTSMECDIFSRTLFYNGFIRGDSNFVDFVEYSL